MMKYIRRSAAKVKATKVKQPKVKNHGRSKADRKNSASSTPCSSKKGMQEPADRNTAVKPCRAPLPAGVNAIHLRKSIKPCMTPIDVCKGLNKNEGKVRRK